jgi:hypothetical protein
VIPKREVLEAAVAGMDDQEEPGYTPAEIDYLEEIRTDLLRIPENLRDDQGRQLIRHLWQDPLTYIRKTHFIKTKKPGRVVLFKPNYVQQKLYDAMQVPAKKNRPVLVVILKARQLGCSTFIQSLFHEWMDREPTRSALTISYSSESTVELFQKTLFVRRNQWFPRRAIRDRGKILELDNDSTFFAKTAGTDSVGRGDTFHYLHCSEIPMWPDADEAFTSAMQCVPSEPATCIILESTARGAVGPFYDEWSKSEDGRSDFIPFFAPWFWDPDYTRPFPSKSYEGEFAASLNLEERRLAERHGVTNEQLHWRRWAIANRCQGSVNKFKQEYPSTAQEAFLTTGSPVFDAVAVNELQHNCVPAIWHGGITLNRDQSQKPTYELTEMPAGNLHLWDWPAEKREYVIGADMAEGKVRDKKMSTRRKLVSYSDYQPDYTAGYVIELETGLHVASWHGTINPFDFAFVLYAMGLFYNNALVVPEVNGPGIATVTCLVEQLRYPRVYRARQYALLQQGDLAQQFGWRTLPHTREHLMFRITEAISTNNLFTRDARLVKELRTMERDPNGNPRATGSNKDDRVFALALALQGRYDVFGGTQDRPGNTAAPKQLDPDKRVWDQVYQRMEAIERNRHHLGHPRPPRVPRPGVETDPRWYR